MKVVGVIPARYQSSRLPGKPMIWRVYQQVIASGYFDEVVVAIDDERIEKVCNEYYMKYVMTSKDHDTPTSRLYEASIKIDSDLYVLIMGDEPLVNKECFSLIVPKETSLQGKLKNKEPFIKVLSLYAMILVLSLFQRLKSLKLFMIS